MLLKNDSEKELKELSSITARELIKALKKNELEEYVMKNNHGIYKDEDGDVSQIVFTVGGPYVHLDLYGAHAGCVVAENLEHISHTSIPRKVWLDMKNKLDDYYEISSFIKIKKEIMRLNYTLYEFIDLKRWSVEDGYYIQSTPNTDYGDDKIYAKGLTLKNCIENLTDECPFNKKELFSIVNINEIIETFDLSDMDKTYIIQFMDWVDF